jgi:predicted nucleotidyltransferase
MKLQKKLRLNKFEIETIKKIIFKYFGKSEIYIFGSRLDLSKKGGDIDIYVVPKNKDNLYEKRINAKMELEEKLLIPVDIVIHKDYNFEIEKKAKKGINICVE